MAGKVFKYRVYSENPRKQRRCSSADGASKYRRLFGGRGVLVFADFRTLPRKMRQSWFDRAEKTLYEHVLYSEKRQSTRISLSNRSPGLLCRKPKTRYTIRKLWRFVSRSYRISTIQFFRKLGLSRTQSKSSSRHIVRHTSVFPFIGHNTSGFQAFGNHFTHCSFW